MNDVKNKIREMLEEDFLDPEEAQDLQDESPLISSNILDSITTLKFVSSLEEEFKFEVQPHEVNEENLDTINKIVAFVQSKIT